MCKKNSPHKNQNGSSLIELLVSGTVSSVLAATIASVFIIQSRELDQGIGGSFLYCASNIVTQQVGGDVRKANKLLVDGETWLADGIYAAAVSKHLFMYDNDGGLLKAYRINGKALEESINGNNWNSFTIGQTPVIVDQSSSFYLTQDRKEVVVCLRNEITRKNRLHSEYDKKELFRCRN
jgi:hypothetical protein